MKFLRRYFGAFCVAVLIVTVILPLRNRELIGQQWRGLFTRFDGPVFNLSASDSSSPIVQLYRVKNDPPHVEDGAANEILVTASMHKIVNRCPDDAAALAYYLRSDRRLNMPLNDTGPLSSPFVEWSVRVRDEGAPSDPASGPLSRNVTPETNKIRYNGPFSSKQEYEDTLALIRRGQKLEPQNTYFDWMLLRALLQGDREREAIQVVEKSWQKTDFNDHTNDEFMAMADYLRPRALETEVKYYSLAATQLPHLSGIRAVGRFLAQHTMALRMQKRDAQALEWGRKCLNFARPIRLKSGFWINSIVGSSVENTFLRQAHLPLRKIPFKPEGYGDKQIPASMLTAHPYSLPYLSRQLKQTKVTAELEKEWDITQKWRIKTPRDFDGAVSANVYWPLGWLQRANRYLISSLVGCGVMWVLLALLASFGRTTPIKGNSGATRLFIGGGIGGLSMIAGNLGWEWKTILGNPPLFCGNGYSPSEVIFPSLFSMVNWRLGIGAMPLLFIWLALVNSGALKWQWRPRRSSSDLSYDDLAGYHIGYAPLVHYFDRCWGFLKGIVFFFFRWLAPIGILLGLMASLCFISINFRDESGLQRENLELICGVAMLFVVLILIPALLMVGRVLLQRRPSRADFQLIPAFLWRAQAIMGGFILAASLAIAVLLPLQVAYTDKFNQQFSILEKRETVPNLQSLGLLPRD